jgi:Tryptophan halogenase
MKNINSITIVGGGTAGLISALMLKTKFPQKNITIIESSKIGIVGVGESSTEHWAEFCKFVGIPQLASILECNATFKIGVYFENWSEQDFMHSIGGVYPHLVNAYYKVFGHQISNNCPPSRLQSKKSWENLVSMSNFNNLNDSPTNQYHFDTFALNEFLHKECTKRGIDIIVGDIDTVILDDNTDEILSIRSEEKEHFADFYIDCTGFSRLLLGDVYDIEWVSYSQYLPVNSAIAFATDEMSEYNKYTKSTARNAGWSWTIPTQTRTGNGYVYCDKFISEQESLEEMEIAYGQKLEISKSFKFDPGRLEKSWHKNCFAVGLSQSFVEPLEATSIGSIIQQMFCFTNFLPSYDIDTCNENINNIFDNIVDYIQAHYLVKREDTPFWREVKYNLKLTENLKKYLKMWKNRLPQPRDVGCPWGMFSAVNYIQILYGLRWFDTEKIKQEYEILGKDDNIDSMLNDEENHTFWISHKKAIKMLIDGYYNSND